VIIKLDFTKIVYLVANNRCTLYKFLIYYTIRACMLKLIQQCVS